MKKNSLIIVDDHKLFLDGLKNLVATIDEVNLLGTFSEPENAIDFVWKKVVDIAIIDISMPKMNGAELMQQLIERRPSIKCIVLTMHKDLKNVRAMWKLGAYGYVLKGAEYSVLKEAIITVGNGEKYFDSEIRHLLSSSFNPVLEESGVKIAITRRELKVIQLLDDGLTTEEMSKVLRISPHTISTHRKNIGNKFGTNRVVEILSKARAMGII